MKNLIKGDGNAVSMLEDILSKAVKQQMISDVPLGAFLSGGIDSSVIVSLMQSQSTKSIKTFTVGFDDKSFDEFKFASSVAKHLGTEHNTLHVTDTETREVINDLPNIYDEPFADSSQIPTHLICHSARKKVTVALSGDGGDELFGGYNRYIHGPGLWKSLSYLPSYIRQPIGAIMQNDSR